MYELVSELEERVELAEAGDNVFVQEQVIKGGAFEEAEGDKEKGLCFCIFWLQFLAWVSLSNKREKNLLTFVKEAGGCQAHGSNHLCESQEMVASQVC